MSRPYTVKKIKETFINLKSYLINPSFGTDIIVGFPGETDKDFQDTYNLCQQIGFNKIHVFRFSPRANTLAQTLLKKFPPLSKEEVALRSQKLRNLTQ